MTIKQELITVNCSHIQRDWGMTRVEENMSGHLGSGMPTFHSTHGRGAKFLHNSSVFARTTGVSTYYGEWLLLRCTGSTM